MNNDQSKTPDVLPLYKRKEPSNAGFLTPSDRIPNTLKKIYAAYGIKPTGPRPEYTYRAARRNHKFKRDVSA